MAHLRERYLSLALRQDMSWSPIVSLMGMRQVGKTTLLKQFTKSYYSLDDDSILREFENGNWALLESAKQPVVIDEAQKSSGLFDRIKLLVDRQKRPGKFLLTGSVRFLSKKGIRESLTGRTSILELLPLTLSEAHSQKQSEFLRVIADRPAERCLQELRDTHLFQSSTARHYLQTGGLPGICFKRDSDIQSRMWEELLETQLMRDLQSLIRTKVPFTKLKLLLKGIAQGQGQAGSISALARSVQLSTPTVIQLLQGFEGLFLLRTHGKHYFMTDCGLARHLGADRVDNELFQMERLVYQELYAQLNYQFKSQFSFGPYQSRGGVRIPFVIELRNRQTIALIIDPTSGASEKSLKSLTWFSKNRKLKADQGVVLHNGEKGYVSGTGALCIPYYWIL